MPIQKQPMACNFFALSKTFFEINVLERIPKICTSLIALINSSSLKAPDIFLTSVYPCSLKYCTALSLIFSRNNTLILALG